MDLALLCDIRIASENGKLAAVTARRNLLPESGGSWLLPRLIGWAKASEMFFRGQTLNAQQCKEVGLVNEVVPHDQLMSTAKAWAEEICVNAPAAIQATKRMMRQGLEESYETTVDHLMVHLQALFGMDDFMEGLSEPVTGTITSRDAQRFALAAGDRNPLYFDEAAARAAGYRTTLVPPVLLAWSLNPPRPLDDLRADGLYRGEGKRVTLNVKRVMFGGEEWEFLEPVFAGDTITSETRLKSLEEKSGGSGPFVLQMTETTYTNQDGAVVARAVGRSIAR